MLISAAIMSTTALAHVSYAGEAALQIERSIGAKIVSKKPSFAPGYDVYLATKDGKQRVFYETNDGKHLFYGIMMDAAGNNITSKDIANLNGKIAPTAQPQSTPAASQAPVEFASRELINAVAKTKSVKEGSGKKVYVVFDPNCPYCKALYAKTRGYLANSEIHWIPVGVLTPPDGDSPKRAAAILRGGDKLASKGFDDVAPVSPTQQELATVLQTNVQPLIVAKATQVPFIIWQDSTGPKSNKGLPSDEEIKKIFGGK